MHTLKIIATKATSAEEAQKKVCEFMEFQKGRIYDWYVIGGRFSWSLNPLAKEFREKVQPIFEKWNSDFLTQDEIEELQPELQKIWEEMGGEGKNPINRNKYREGHSDDIRPMTKEDIERQILENEEYKNTLEKDLKDKIEQGSNEYDMEISMHYRSLADLYDEMWFTHEYHWYRLEELFDEWYRWSINPPESPEWYWIIALDLHY